MKYLRTILIFGLLLSQAHAADSPEEVARKAVLNLVPQAKIEKIEKSPLDGFYQVLTSGQLLYVSPDGQYVFQGHLFDAKAKQDVTEVRLANAHKAKLEEVPTAGRLVFAPEKPKYKITVFTDIDCGYCRKMHAQIAEYNQRGIEVDYLFFPRSGPGGDSFNKAISVWCNKDRKSAFSAAKAGQNPQSAQCENPIAEQFQLGMDVGVDGTPTIFAPNGTRIGGYLTPDQMLAKLASIAAE